MKNILLNTTNKNIPVTRKNGGTFMLAPKAKMQVDPNNYGTLPKGVVLK